MSFKWQPFALKQILLVSAIFLLLFVFPLQSGRTKVGKLPSNDEQKIFDITQSALPEHYVTLLFGMLEHREWDLLYWKVSAFQLTRVIRQEWDKIKDKKKVLTKAKGSKSAKAAASSSIGGSATTAAEDVEELRKLVYVELSDYVKANVVNKRIVERIRQIWIIFQRNNQTKTLQNSDVGKGKNNEENDNLGPVTQVLHMMAIKQLLLAGKNANNELIEKFKDFPLMEEKNDKEKKHEQFMTAKLRLRSMVGEQAMFEELELQEPLLIRLDLIEPKEEERLYMQFFASPEPNKQAQAHLEISALLGKIIGMTRPEKSTKKLQEYWDKTVAKGVQKDDNKKKLEKIWKRMKDWYKIVRDQQKKPEEYPDVEKELLLTHARQLQSIYWADDGRFMQFVNVNPGVRARVQMLLGADTPEIFLLFNTLESAMLDQLATNYVETVNDAKTKLKRLKTLETVHVLVLLRWLDKHLPGEIKMKWYPLRDMFMLFLDRMVDEKSIEKVDNTGNYYKNVLFKLIDCTEGRKKLELLKAMDDLELLKQMVKNHEYHSEIIEPCTELQTQWLGYEHRQMLLALLARDGSKSKAIRRLRDLSPEKVELLAALLIGGKEQKGVTEIVKVFTENATRIQVIKESARDGKEETSGESKAAHIEEGKSVDGEKLLHSEHHNHEMDVWERNSETSVNEAENALKSEWSGNDALLAKLAENYRKLVTEGASELVKTRARVIVDVLVQIRWIDDKYLRKQLDLAWQQLAPNDGKTFVSLMHELKETNDEFIEWEHSHTIFLLFLHELNGHDEQDYVKNQGILYKNLLFEIIKGNMSFHQVEVLENDLIDNAVSANEGKQAEWLAREHVQMLEQLREDGALQDLSLEKMNQLTKLLIDGSKLLLNDPDWKSLVQHYGHQTASPHGEMSGGSIDEGKHKEVSDETTAIENLPILNAKNNPILIHLSEMYLQLVAKHSSMLERKRARTAVDVLVQIHWLDNKFIRAMPENEMISSRKLNETPKPKQFLTLHGQKDPVLQFAEWAHYRKKFLLLMEQLIEQEDEFMVQFANMFKNVLYKLIVDEGEGSLREAMETLVIAEKSRSIKITGEDMVKKQAEWLAKEHKIILELLRGNGMIRDLNHYETEELAKLLGDNQDDNEQFLIMNKNQQMKQIEEAAKGEKLREMWKTPAEEVAKRKGKAHVAEGEEHDDEWTDTNFLINKLAELYLQLNATKATDPQSKRIRAATNVLVQLLWADRFFRSRAVEGNVHADWAEEYRPMFVQFLKQLEAGKGDEEWVEKYEILYGNMLYKVRWLKALEEAESPQQKHWELGDLLEMELEELKQFKERERQGKQLPDIEHVEPKTQAEWLSEEHANTIKNLLLDPAREDFKRKISEVVTVSKLLEGNNGKALVESELLEQVQMDLQVEKVFFECSSDQGRGEHAVGSEFEQDPYIHFLEEKDNLDFWKREVDIQMLTWLFINIVSKVFLEANKELGSELEELAKIKAEWDELLGGMETSRVMEALLRTGVANMEVRETKEQSLCRYHAFVVKSILENNKLAKVGGLKWTNVVKETGLSGNLVKWLRNLPGLKLDPRCGPEHSAAVVTELIDHPDRSNAHFVFLDMRIRSSKQLRHFFCGGGQPNKDRLLRLVGVKGLALLEEGHPDILKIEKMHPKVQFHLYTVYIKHLNGTSPAEEAELRIALPWLVEILKMTENDQNIATNSELGKAIRNQTRKLRLDLYQDKEWGLISTRSVCLMGKFLAFVKSIQDQESDEISGKKAKGKKRNSEALSTKDPLAELNKKVENWNAMECKNEKIEKNTLLDQRKKFAWKHQNFITDHYGQFVDLDELGWRAKVKKLAPDFQFNDYDWETFTNVSRLQRLLHTTLCTDSDEQYWAPLLGVHFIIWANYIDAELEQKPVDSVERTCWEKNRKRLLVRLDEQFDQSFERLILMIALIDVMLNGFTSLLLKDQNLWKPVMKEPLVVQQRWMENTFVEILENKCKQWHKIWDKQSKLGLHKKYISWMDASVRGALLGLLKPEKPKADEGGEQHALWMSMEAFRAEIKQSLLLRRLNKCYCLISDIQERPEVKKRLKRLVGSLGVKPVAKALGLKKWTPEEFGTTKEQMEENKENKDEKDFVASFWPKAPYAFKLSNTKADGSGSSETSKASDFSSGQMPLETSGKKQRSRAKNTHLGRNSPLESRPSTPVQLESMVSEHHMSEAPADESMSNTSSVMTGVEPTSHSEASPRVIRPTAPMQSPKSLAAKPMEVQESHFGPTEDSTLTMDEGEWELPKASKKKQAKTAPSESHGAAGSPTHKEHKISHPSRTKASDEINKHGLFKHWGPSPGANLSDYFANAKPTGVKKKKGDTGEEIQPEADIHALKPIAPMVPTDESVKDTGKVNAIASEMEAMPREKLKPAIGLTAIPKPTGALINFGTFGEGSEVKDVRKEDYSLSHLKFGSLDTQILEAAKQQTPLEQSEHQPKPHNGIHSAAGSGQTETSKKSLSEQEIKSLPEPVSADVVSSKDIHMIETGHPMIEGDQTEGHVNKQKDTKMDLEKPVERIGAEAKEKELLPPSPKRGENKAILRSNHATRMPGLTIRTKGSAAMVPHHPLNVRSDSIHQQWMQRAHVEVHALRELVNEKKALNTANLSRAVENLEIIVHSWSYYWFWKQHEFGVHIKEAILLFTGSYLLKLHTSDSDIDGIVLLPFAATFDLAWEFLYKQLFFGDENEKEVLCDLNLEPNKSQCSSNWSLYCGLCKTPNVTSLHKLKGRDQIPMITMKFHGFDFDLLFVTLPMQRMPFVDWNLSSVNLKSSLSSLLPSVDATIVSFIGWIDLIDDAKRIPLGQEQSQKQASIPEKDSRKGMLLALSGYRANLLIKILTAKRDSFQLADPLQVADSFQLAYMALKLWAKNHFIYGGKFGFLNGTTLTMLLLQVFLKHSNVSAPDLLLHFFETYSKWKWPDPVELDKAHSHRAIYNSQYYSSLDWNPDKEKSDRFNHYKLFLPEYRDEAGNQYLGEHGQLVWPVIVPGFPTQNAAFNVNGWTKQAMQREFENGLAQMKDSLEAIRAEVSPKMHEMRHNWAQWVNGGDFQEKYDHFMAIVCAAQSAEILGEFCDFVEGRIRLQILFDFGDASLFKVKWMHASPKKVRRDVPCPSAGEEGQLLLPADNNWRCTIWLVGIQLVEGVKQEGFEQILKQKLEKVERNQLEDFSHKIFRSFKGKGRIDTSSPHGSSKSPRSSPSTSAETPRTPDLSPMSSAAAIVEEQSKKVWTMFFTKEKLKEWLKQIPSNTQQ